MTNIKVKLENNEMKELFRLHLSGEEAEFEVPEDTKKVIVTLTGVSLAGKSHMMKHLESLGVAQIVSHTTREPRTGEQNVVDYYFVSEEEFSSTKMVEFVEFGGNKYGISVEELLSRLLNNEVIAVILNPNGLGQFLEYFYNVGWKDLNFVSVFLDIDVELQMERLKKRRDAEVEASSARKIAERAVQIRTKEKSWRSEFMETIEGNRVSNLYIKNYEPETEDAVNHLLNVAIEVATKV